MHKHLSAQKRSYFHPGFTIVELLVVIVVIAILAAVATVAYTGIQARARDTQNEMNVTNILRVAEAHHAAEGEYPSSTPGYTDSSGEYSFMGRFTSSVAGGDGIYKSPAAPDWLPGSFFRLEDNHYGPSDWDDDEPMTSIWVPDTLPPGHATWDEFYEALDDIWYEWVAVNPEPTDWDEDAWDTHWGMWSAHIAANHPDYICALSECSEDGGSYRDVQKQWIYFVERLVDPARANDCYGLPPTTGYKITYYSEARQEWLSKQIGSGIKRHQLC